MNMKHYNGIFLLLMAAGLGLTACQSAADTDTEMDRFVSDLMSRMTLEEKVGQLNLKSNWMYFTNSTVNEEATSIKQVKQGLMGGVYGFTNPEMISMLQHYAVDSTRLGIPLLFGNDVIHGFETIYPIPLAISTSWDMAMIEQSARMAAREASSVGINWVFSPMVDICRDARWGRISEGGGEDPYLGGEIAKAYVRGYQGQDLSTDSTVMVCVKHYALYGGAESGKDYNSVFLSRQEAHNGFLNPYRQAVLEGAGSFMSSFNEFEGIPASINQYLLTDVLRQQWGFDGFVVSDATALNEVIEHGIGDQQEVSRRGIEAGLDMDMGSDAYVSHLVSLVNSGKVKEQTIDKACRNILNAKWKLGLFDDPYRYLVEGRAEREIYNESQLSFARRIAQECQVLLKNEHQILPLKKNARIALVGPFANEASEMQGAWAMSSRASQSITILQGIEEVVVPAGGKVQYAKGSYIFNDEAQESSVRFGIMKMFNPDFVAPKIQTTPQSQLIAQAVAAARQSDVVVACVGELNNMAGEGACRTDISMTDAQSDLLKALKATGKPLVVVLTTGRPLVLNWESEHADAILCTWGLGAEAGHAIADVLFGDVNPSARLTTSFPRSVGQLPLYYNHKNTGRPHPDDAPYQKFRSCYEDVVNSPLYCFGYGLSYTTFEYGDVTLNQSRLSANGTVTASIDVKNTGSRAGKETVQLYIHDVYSSSTRPVKELRKFKQVELQPGQTKTVSFELTQEDLKYYDHEINYVCEPGEFEIMIGPNSRDVRSATLVAE